MERQNDDPSRNPQRELAGLIRAIGIDREDGHGELLLSSATSATF
jgi:hypothetical protein